MLRRKFVDKTTCRNVDEQRRKIRMRRMSTDAECRTLELPCNSARDSPKRKEKNRKKTLKVVVAIVVVLML